MLTQEDEERLYRNGLRDSTLREAPEWLKKWASLICEYLEFEEILYPDYFKDETKQYGLRPEDLKIDAKLQKET